MPAYSLEEYLGLEEDKTVWVWRGLIPVSGSALLFANPKVGKSKVALSLSEAICDPGRGQFLGLGIDVHGPVLYIQLDTPRNLWKDGYIKHVEAAKMLKQFYTIDRRDPDLPKQFDIRIPQHNAYVRHEVDRIQPVLVIVDTVIRMHKGNENESDTSSQIHDAFVHATEPAALLYITHKRKSQGDAGGDGTVRGSTAMAGAVDALLNMTKTKLIIEARSDAPEEIPILSDDNGVYHLDTQQDEKLDFVKQLSGSMSETAKTEAIMAKFGVSDRTARKYKKLGA